MKISLQLHQRFLDHSRRYYDVETYDTILKNLLDCYDKHNEDVRWWNNNINNNDNKD